MPRIGVITDEISEDLEYALSVCADLGIRDVELRSVWNTSIVELPDEELFRIEKLLVEGDVDASSIASPFLKCPISGDGEAAGLAHSASHTTREDQWDVLGRSLQVANQLDAPMVRAFSFWRVDDPVSVRDDILETLREATVRTKAAGKRLGLENEPACNVATASEAAWYLERIDDPTLGLIWDPGNVAAMGIQPTPGEIDAFRQRIHHVHIKDAASLTGNDGFTVIGEGIVGWDAQCRFLEEIGYDGVLSLETHFDMDGRREPATRACVAALRQIAADAGLTMGVS